MIVDERVHPLVADPHPPLGAGDVAIAGDGVTGPREPDKPLGIDVQQITGTRPLIPPRLLARLRGGRDIAARRSTRHTVA